MIEEIPEFPPLLAQLPGGAKDRIFANINLADEELRLYETVANELEEKIIRPDLVVYLQASTEVLLQP